MFLSSEEKKKKETQAEKVLEYLKKGNTINCFQAVELFKIHYLSGIILRLKKKGYRIAEERKVGSSVQDYFLLQENIKVGA